MELYKFFKMIYFASITWLYNDQSRVKILVDLKSFQSTSCVRERRTRTGYPNEYILCFNSSSIFTISANTLISVRRVLDVWTDFGTAYAMPDSRPRLNVTCGKCSPIMNVWPNCLVQVENNKPWQPAFRLTPSFAFFVAAATTAQRAFHGTLLAVYSVPRQRLIHIAL